MDKEVVVDDMWTPYKELLRTVESGISSPSQETYDELVKALQRHRQNFLTLLKNPCKNETHRQELNKGCSEGMELHGIGQTVLPKELVTEAIILSDMYDLNEYMALDLLGTAQVQMPNYPGLSRGVVAILLYYDGRKSLVWTLRTLAEARQGNLWTVETSPQVLHFITHYMDQLIADGLVSKILGLIDNLSLTKELEILQRNRALGPAKYHQQVVDLFQSTRSALAEVVFLYTAQSGLPKEPAMTLLNYMRKLKPEELPTGEVDNISMALIMAFLYILDLSLLHKEDGEVVQKRVALISKCDDGQFLKELQKEFSESNSECQQWADPGLHSLIMFAWALTISNLRLVPTLIPKNVDLDNPDLVMENAIEKKVFTYLNTTFLKSKCLYTEQEFYARRIHTLFTDFIVQMPQKVKEMRLKAEETDKTIKAYIGGGIDPPKTLECHFEQVLLSMAKFYSSDKLKLQLGYDYWYKVNELQASSFPYKTLHKQSTLFNFIVATGEGLLMMLFVPYIKLLTALSMFPRGAQQCFSYLRDNPEGVLKPPSWAHFFNTLNRYLNNLKQETLPATDTFYRQRNYTKGITPQELEGLYAVLDLIKTVAGNDVSRGEVIVQNARWGCLPVLIGLLSCPLELRLKAKILETLAAFARSPIICTNLWQSIETAQIIPTLNTTSAYYPKGIQTDIEEGESRAEEYPVSKAWMQLLISLSAKSFPRLLGTPDRTPGFDPYLHFTIQYILLRLSSRRYKESKEKWEVCEVGMKLLEQLLLQYDPTEPDETTSQVNPLPGYHIMVSLNSQTELLRLMLDTIDEGTHMLESYTEFEGKKNVECSLLSILKCLQHSLAHQQALMTKLSSSNSMLLLPGLSKLILAVNPNSNKPDHLLNIAKFVMFGDWEEKLAAVSVLRLAGESGPMPRSHLLALLTSTPALRVNMRHAFVCLLESEDMSSLVSKTKLALSKLLLQSLSHGVPNIAHYLFGFDLNKEIKKTVFEQPGVLGMPRTCLHSIMSQLNASLKFRHESSPQVLESFYRLIHALAANPKTSEPVLRFLRSSDFLKTHLNALPFTNAPTGYEMNQMAWLLKTVAIEMRVTASSKQLSQLCSLVQTFVGEGRTNNQDSCAVPQHKDHLLLQLIKSVDFHIDPAPIPPLEYFEIELLDKALSNCEVSEGKIKLIDIDEVRIILEKNFSIVKGKSSSTQRQLLQQEMEVILVYVEEVNERRRFSDASVHFLDGWRQSTEVMLSTATTDALPHSRRINLIVDTIHTLLTKASGSVHPEVGVLVSNSVLLFSVDLRQLCGGGDLSVANEAADVTLDDTASQINLVLDSNLHKITSIISNLVKWILASGSYSQKVRVNLYCGLVNLVQVGGIEGGAGNGVSRDASQYVSMLDRTRAGRHPGLDTLLLFKDRLLDMLCHDSAIGHDISKMVALSVLDMIVSKESHASWAGLLSSRGYFKFLIESLMSSDNELTALLSFNCKSLRPLYVYESKMALLCRVASTEAGAELLLEQNVLSCLSALSVFNKHPDIAPIIPLRSGDEDEFIPTVSARYLQVLSPVLYLCDSLLSTLGVDNHAAVTQVIKFIVGQGETMSQVLRSGSPYHPLPFLKELSQVTGVIARATNQQVTNEEAKGLEEGASQTRFHRFKSLMLALVSRFVISESLFKEIESEARHKSNPASPADQRAPVLTFLQIASHLVLYARNLVSSSHSDRRICNVIFQPALCEAARHSYDRRENTLSLQEATLGVIVLQLGQAVAHHQREKGNLDMAVRKLKSLPDMATPALKQMLPEPLANIMEVEECRRAAGRILSEQIDVKQKEIDYCYFIIEHCLFIIWAHLDYYMLIGLPAKIFGLPKSSKQLAPSMEYDVTWSVTVEDINHLKQGLLSVFNDTFSKTLISTAQDMPASDKGFLEALLRRIQKLIQFAPSS